MAALRSLLTFLVFATTLIGIATAATITVGGPNGGWDTSTNFQTWASSQKFSVGDILVFQYNPSHDVTEVSKTDYDSCQATNPIQKSTGGSTSISLTSPGKRYFICSTPGHCALGMKLQVDTLATTSPPSTSPTPAPAISPPVTSPRASPPLKSPSASPPAKVESPSPSPLLAGPASSPSPSSISPPPSPPPLSPSPAPQTSVPSPATVPGSTSPSQTAAEPPKSSANRRSLAITSMAVGTLCGTILTLLVV